MLQDRAPGTLYKPVVTVQERSTASGFGWRPSLLNAHSCLVRPTKGDIMNFELLGADQAEWLEYLQRLAMAYKATFGVERCDSM